MRATWIGLALLACLVLAPRAAGAQAADATAEAQKYYEAGRQAFAAGQFNVAIAAFEEAYKLAPRTSVKFSLAMAYRAQYFIDNDPFKVRRAVELYRAVIEEVAQGELREKAAGHLAELSPVVMRLDDDARRAQEAEEARRKEEERRKAEAQPPGGGDVQPPPNPVTPPAPVPVVPVAPPPKTQLMITSRTTGARATIDGGPLADMPVIGEVSPGKHTVRVELDGYFAQTVEGVAVEGRLIVVEVNLQPMPATLTIDAPAGADITVDGKPAGTAPLRAPLELTAGMHHVTVLKRGFHAWAADVEVGRGEKKSVMVHLDKTTQRKASYWVLGAAGALFLAGGGSSLLALSAQGDAEAIEAKLGRGENITPAEVDEHAQLRDRRDGYSSASYLLYGGAFVVATTGLFLYYVDQPRTEQAPAGTTLVPAVQDGGFSVSLLSRF